MINGESHTGITLFQTDDGIDKDASVSQSEKLINDSNTVTTLYARIEAQGLALHRVGIVAIGGWHGRAWNAIHDGQAPHAATQFRGRLYRLEKNSRITDRFVKVKSRS